MRVAVRDTYVNKKDGGVMHFDILVPADKNQQHKKAWIFHYRNGRL